MESRIKKNMFRWLKFVNDFFKWFRFVIVPLCLPTKRYT